MYIMGVRHEKSGDYQKAVAAFEQCVRMEPANRPAHVHLGMLYEDHMHDLFAAMYHYSRGCAENPDDAYAQLAARSLERVSGHFAASRMTPAPEPPPAAPDGELKRLRHQVSQLSQQRADLVNQLKLKNDEIMRLKHELELPPPPDIDNEDPVVAAGEIRVETIYTVKKGDTLYRIARERYGNDATWEQLRDYNEDVLHGADLLRPGMKIRIPDLETLRKETGDGE